MNEFKIEVRIVDDGSGYFIGRAVGFRGVIASGASEDQVMERIARSWVAIYRAKASKTPLKFTSEKPFSGQVHQRNLLLQSTAA